MTLTLVSGCMVLPWCKSQLAASLSSWKLLVYPKTPGWSRRHVQAPAKLLFPALGSCLCLVCQRGGVRAA